MRKIELGQKFGEWTSEETVVTGRGVRCKCSCSCGNIRDVLACELLAGNTLKCRNHKKGIDLLSGEKHGCYEVVSFSHMQGKNAFYLCKCDCGAMNKVRKSQLLHRPPEFCKKCHQNNPPVGSKFGCWEIVGFDETSPKGVSRWLAKCDCGCVEKVRSSNILRGISTKCLRCKRKGLSKIRGRRFCEGTFDVCNEPQDVDTIPYWFWHTLQVGAAARNLEFELTQNEALDVLHKQKGRCSFTGSVLKFSKNRKGTTASVDRKNGGLGYTKENIQWVHKHVNMAKAYFGNEYFVSICNAVVAFQL